MSNSWADIFFKDITGRRIRLFPELSRFGAAKAQDLAFKRAQRAVMWRNRGAWLIPLLGLAVFLISTILLDVKFHYFLIPYFIAVYGYHRMIRTSIRRELLRLIDEDIWCRSCGYVLVGNISGQCPECGDAIPEVQRLNIRSPNVVAAAGKLDSDELAV